MQFLLNEIFTKYRIHWTVKTFLLSVLTRPAYSAAAHHIVAHSTTLQTRLLYDRWIHCLPSLTSLAKATVNPLHSPWKHQEPVCNLGSPHCKQDHDPLRRVCTAKPRRTGWQTPGTYIATVHITCIRYSLMTGWVKTFTWRRSMKWAQTGVSQHWHSRSSSWLPGGTCGAQMALPAHARTTNRQLSEAKYSVILIIMCSNYSTLLTSCQ